MTNPREQYRKGFEAWVRTQDWFIRDDYSLKPDLGGGYYWLLSQRAFEGYCAAMESVTSDAAVRSLILGAAGGGKEP